MSRYIDADAIEESILDKWGVDPKYLDDSLEASKDSYMLDWVNSAPTIDIVRCGECKRNNYCCRYISPNGRKPDDFCSYGERNSSEKQNNSTTEDCSDVGKE